MKTLALGPVTVHRVIELERWPFAPAEMFPGITEEHVQAAGRALGKEHVDPRDGQLVMSIQTYVIRTPHATVLVDTGNGNDKPRPALRAHHMFRTGYLDRLGDLGIAPGDVDVVVSTHLHPDHCGWNTRLSEGAWVPTFPRARHLFPRAELDHLAAIHRAGPGDAVAADLARTFEDSVRPVLDAGLAVVIDTPYTVWSDGDARITVRDAPGHTPGHVVVELDADGRRAVFTGDLIHHPLQFADPDLAQAGDHDPILAARTRRGLCESYADRDAVILPAHFAGPGAGTIARAAAGYRFDWLEG
jgi:glyoxylase-like metal-dependent hydrolase (beta-lactamase superfamily II)